MEFKVGEAETKHWAALSHEQAINYLLQSQQCDLVAQACVDKPINIHTDYSPEEMMTRRKINDR